MRLANPRLVQAGLARRREIKKTPKKGKMPRNLYPIGKPRRGTVFILYIVIAKKIML